MAYIIIIHGLIEFPCTFIGNFRYTLMILAAQLIMTGLISFGGSGGTYHQSCDADAFQAVGKMSSNEISN